MESSTWNKLEEGQYCSKSARICQDFLCRKSDTFYFRPEFLVGKSRRREQESAPTAKLTSYFLLRTSGATSFQLKTEENLVLSYADAILCARAPPCV